MIKKYLLHITYVAVPLPRPLHCSIDEPKLTDFNTCSTNQTSY